MNIFSKLLHKWFDIEPDSCPTCEVLGFQLDIIRRDNERLLMRVIAPNIAANESAPNEDEPQVIRGRNFVPMRVRQQLIQENDRRTLTLMQEHKKQMDTNKNVNQDTSKPENPEVMKRIPTEELEKEVLGEDFEKYYDETIPLRDEVR